MLIAVVLMGMAVTATLATLRTTIVATGLNRDHANAHAWLQTAADVLYAAELVNCSSPAAATIEQQYRDIIQATHNPENWAATNIDIVGEVEFWNIERDATTSLKTEFWSPSQCDDQSDLQRVTIRVQSPDDHRIIEEVSVIVDA